MIELFNEGWRELPTTPEKDFGWQSPWIYDQGSLTEKLRSVCKSDLNVKVLHHAVIRSSEKAASALNLTTGESILHREVLLCDGEIPLVFACSLLPEVALVGRYEELKQLGSRPLGHWIFQEPILTRFDIQTIELPCESGLFARLFPTPQNAASIVGRKTLFTGPKKPFLVSEFFLPALQDQSCV